jgi:hypothetical protein
MELFKNTDDKINIDPIKVFGPATFVLATVPTTLGETRVVYNTVHALVNDVKKISQYIGSSLPNQTKISGYEFTTSQPDWMLDEIVIALDYLFGTVEGLDPGVDYPRYSDFRNRTTLMSTIINDQEIFQLYLQDASITKAHM